MEAKKGKPKCSCGFRIRGPNHEQGQHHKQGGKVGKTRSTRYRKR